MNTDEFLNLPDVTPDIHYIETGTTDSDGHKIIRPRIVGFMGAIFQKEDDGIHIYNNELWSTGWIGDKHIRRKCI